MTNIIGDQFNRCRKALSFTNRSFLFWYTELRIFLKYLKNNFVYILSILHSATYSPVFMYSTLVSGWIWICNRLIHCASFWPLCYGTSFQNNFAIMHFINSDTKCRDIDIICIYLPSTENAFSTYWRFTLISYLLQFIVFNIYIYI